VTTDYYCKRPKADPRIRFTPFSQRFVAVTSYTPLNDLVNVHTGGKHDVHRDVLCAVAEFLQEQGAGEYDAAAEFLLREAKPKESAT
jgi:hypothetical protein